MKTVEPLPQGQEKYRRVRDMFDTIAPTYEKANTFITFGLDKRARRITLKELRCAPGSLVIDLASGTGDITRMLHARSITAIACDYSFGMLANGHGNFDRVQGDGASLPFADNSCDGVTCGYALRNFVELSAVFDEIMRVLKPGGRFVAVDVSVPSNAFLRFGNRVWLHHVVPKIGYLISKNKQAYEYLPRSTSYLPPSNEIEKFLVESGAENVRISPLVGGSLILVCATKA